MPAPLSFVTKPFVDAGAVAVIALAVGKFVEAVSPVTYASPFSTAIARPRSRPLPPRYVA